MQLTTTSTYIQEHQFLLAQQSEAIPLYHASIRFPPEISQMLVSFAGFLLSCQDGPHPALPTGNNFTRLVTNTYFVLEYINI